MLFAFFGTWDLVIIAFIAMLLFGNRLPSMMRGLGHGHRCPHCGWYSLDAYHCRNCGRPKLPALISRSPPELRSTMGQGQTKVHLPRWLLALLVATGAAWLVDFFVTPNGLWFSATWRDAWHWATLCLLLTALASLVVVVVKSHYRDQ